MNVSMAGARDAEQTLSSWVTQTRQRSRARYRGHALTSDSPQVNSSLPDDTMLLLSLQLVRPGLRCLSELAESEVRQCDSNPPLTTPRRRPDLQPDLPTHDAVSKLTFPSHIGVFYL